MQSNPCLARFATSAPYARIPLTRATPSIDITLNPAYHFNRQRVASFVSSSPTCSI